MKPWSPVHHAKRYSCSTAAIAEPFPQVVFPKLTARSKFQGKGRVVLTASDSTQYSFEGNHVVGEGTRSVFTRSLVRGLTTGEADLDSDGDISIDELYSYVHDRVVEEMPQQRPKKTEKH